jgi:hypothetical protein
MGNSADEIRVAGNGSVFVAEPGTTLPASISVALGAGFINTGYINDDGVTFLDGKTVEPINVWQSFYPPRQIVTEKEASAAFALMQWDLENLKLAYGGGDVVEDAPGEYSYHPPQPGEIDERIMVIEWVDGDYNYRLIIPNGMVSENVETELTKSAASELPITFAILGEDGVDPWYLQTDDPAFNPAGSS